MECTPLEAWSIYTSINLHFKIDSPYDAIKYNFRGPKCSREKFLARQDRWKYEKLVRDYPKRDEFITYCVANILAGNCYIGQVKEEAYLQHKAKIQRLDYTFRNDMCTLAVDDRSFDELLMPSNGQSTTQLYKAYHREEISLETLVILEQLLNFTKDYDKKLIDPLEVSKGISYLVRQYLPFIRNKINVEKCVETLISVFK